jgi:hypothetical protein
MSDHRHDIEACRAVLVDTMAERNCEVVVSTAPPLAPTPYEAGPWRCPHGLLFWMQPTNDQILKWRQDGVR